ncbi:hypothetical protein KX816_04635 [Sphingosinicellaceae bacterium]|nr:hypothetical protein KX816_04635 [Sphingosinicellaceae bacterium]
MTEETPAVEMERHREMLLVLGHGSVGPIASEENDRADAIPMDEDAEADEWTSLILNASTKLVTEARLRTCVAGLAAVNRYIDERTSTDR